MCKSLRAHCPWTGSTSYPAPRHFQAPRLSSAADYWLEDEICDESGNLPWDFSEMEGWTKNVREKLCAMQHFKECEIDSISMGCNSTSQDQNTFLFLFYIPTQGHFFWRGLLARQAILNMRWATPHCGLLSFHLCLRVTKLHVAKLIDQLTVIPSEFLTRWRSSPLCIFQPDYLYHIDIGKVYVSSFHLLYWRLLRLSDISGVQALEAFLRSTFKRCTFAPGALLI